MIYSVNYPIIYELPTPVVGRLYEYRINYGTTEDLFVGRVIGNGGGTQIDISRILQKFTDVCYYDKIYSLQDVMYFNTLNDEHNNSYFSVIVIDMNTGVRTPFDVMYNYNTDYINQYPYTLLLNDPITNKVDRRQRINLSSFVVNRKFDYEQFKNAVFTTTIALNDVLDEAIDLNPLDIQRENARQWRPIGLGIMGLADCLIKLGLKYGSQSAINFCNDLSATMLNSAIECSVYEAKHKGAFPLINLEAMINSKFFVENVNDNIKELMKIYGIRNSQLLACAPTGSISTMLGISGSLEPIFANYYMRRTQSLHGKDVEYKVYTPIVKEYMDENNIINDSDLPDYFITSQEIPYRERIDMQSIWQKNIDNSISSTVNLPNSASLDDVIDLYLYAWEKKLKGITIYRTGCKREGILTFDKQSSEHQTFDSISPINKDELGETYGVNVKRKVACGNLYLNVCRDKDGNLVEMFVNTGKGGICQSNINAISRLISMSLRSGVKVNEIVDQLKSIICPACTKSSSKGDKLSGLSCPDVIARFLLKEYNREEIVIKNPHASCIEECSIEVQNFNSCPDCGANLIYEGGCITCKECGWSKCQ